MVDFKRPDPRGTDEIVDDGPGVLFAFVDIEAIPDGVYTYEPDEEDLAWANQVIRLLRQNGIVSMTNGQLKLDHDKKHVTVYGVPEPWVYAAHVAVFGKLGWTVGRAT
jgi:hypothetical protein